jgi:hypothetical protein
MSKGIPVDDGNAHPTASPAGTEAAASAGLGYTGNGSGLDVEVDEYDELLATIGRTEEQDRRVACHEAGHIVVARLLGHPLGGATVDPGPGYEGRVWGKRHVEAFTHGRGDASDVREILAPIMPQAGEDRSSMSDVFANIYGHCIELMAGRVAERMLLSDDDTRSAGHDLRQARELAMLICRSEEAIETFIAHCDIVARDLLMPYGDVMIALSTVLRIKRTLDGTEIDALIFDLQARKAAVIERHRRNDWRNRELAAKRFEAEAYKADAASMPHFAPDRVR